MNIQWQWSFGIIKKAYTSLKFNMEPENQPLEKEIPFENHPFQVPC